VVATFRQLVIGAIPRRRKSIVVSRHSDKCLDDTIEFWRPRIQRELSPEDARQIAENLSGFFKVLREWEATERQGSERG
jgi:hypothetical protein